MEGNANKLELAKVKWSLIRDAANAGHTEQVDRLLVEVGEPQLKQCALDEIAFIAQSNLDYLDEYGHEYLEGE